MKKKIKVNQEKKSKPKSIYTLFFKRLIDLILSGIGLIILAIPMLIVAVIIKCEDPGPAIFKQKRIGNHKKYFYLYKFRSMKMDTPRDVPTHLLKNPEQYILKFGKFIRKASIDELPQLWNIFKGDMSIVGPRPALWNQDDLIAERDKYGANDVQPGLTGWAQVNGRDELEISEKARLDGEYVAKQGFLMDMNCFIKTITRVLTSEGVVEGGTGNIKKGKVNKKRKLVSIIVPVYNAEKYLKDTIECVLNQTYNNYELLLINDCSKDNSKKVYEKFKSNKKITWIDMKKNGGAALARNKGIELAKGKYICFLDADDLWEKEKLEKQVIFMEEKNCEFSFTGYEFADKDCKPTGKKVYIPEKINYRQALKNTTICTITVMFDMEKLTKDDIYMPNVKSEDTATWWKVLKKVDYAYGLNEILSYYRRGINSSSSNKFKAVKQAWDLYRKVEKLNIFYSMYNFCWYAFNAVRRRL